MSITGYFESILDNWKTIKRTPTVKRDMKIVLHQFGIAVQHDEIDKDKLEYLKKQFKNIHHEVYD